MLAPRRDFRLLLPEGDQINRMVMPLPHLIWVLTFAELAANRRWRIFDMETGQQVATCGQGETNIAVVAGLDPPGLALQGADGPPRFVTPLGNPHSLELLLLDVRGSDAATLPFDHHVACMFGDIAEGETRKVAIVPIRRGGSGGPRRQMSWATPTVEKWLCATSALGRGELLALGKKAGGNNMQLQFFVARPTQYQHINMQVKELTNNCALVASPDGEVAYLIGGMISGLRILPDPLQEGDGDFRMKFRASFPQRMPGCVQGEGGESASGTALLNRVVHSRHCLGADELARLWDACDDDQLRLRVFGKLVHMQALTIAEMLRPKVQVIADLSPRAAQSLVVLDAAHERFDAALARWVAIDSTVLDENEARHHRHLRAYLAMMQGDLDLAIELADESLAAEQLMACGCSVRYWRDVAAAVREPKAGATGNVLAELVNSLLQSEELTAEGRCKEARSGMRKFEFEGEPTCQAAARVALTWLRDTTERSADDRFEEAVAMGAFLGVLDRTSPDFQDTLVVPTRHWQRTQLEELAKEAAQRHAEWLARGFALRAPA